MGLVFQPLLRTWVRIFQFPEGLQILTRWGDKVPNHIELFTYNNSEKTNSVNKDNCERFDRWLSLSPFHTPTLLIYLFLNIPTNALSIYHFHFIYSRKILIYIFRINFIGNKITPMRVIKSGCIEICWKTSFILVVIISWVLWFDIITYVVSWLCLEQIAHYIMRRKYPKWFFNWRLFKIKTGSVGFL